MKLIYSDVTKSNEMLDSFFDQLPELERIDREQTIHYGNCYAMYRGFRIEVRIDRNTTYAGNRYLKLSADTWMVGEFKFLIGQEIENRKILKALDKIVNKYIEINKENDLTRKKRAKAGEIFKREYKELSDSYRKTLTINDNTFKVINNMNHCYQINYISLHDFTKQKGKELIEKVLQEQKDFVYLEREQKRIQDNIDKELEKINV